MAQYKITSHKTMDIGCNYRKTMAGALKVVKKYLDQCKRLGIAPAHIIISERHEDNRGFVSWKPVYNVKLNQTLQMIDDVDSEYYRRIVHILKPRDDMPQVEHHENPNDVAFEWFRLGFAPGEVTDWLQTQCYNPHKVYELCKAGLKPRDAEIPDPKNVFTIGYCYCKGEHSLSGVKKLVRNWNERGL